MSRFALLTTDVGPARRYHVGDQAIMSANLEWLRSTLPHVNIRIFAQDPRFSSNHHHVDAIKPPDRSFVQVQLATRFARGSDSRASLGSKSAWSSLCAGEPALLHLAGGGNLTSLFPHEIQLRSFYALLALEASIPVIVTGQTLGPALTADDRRLLSRWVPHVRYFGVRDRQSADLAAALGAAPDSIVTVVDDAYSLTGREPRLATLESANRETKKLPLIGLSLHHRRTSEYEADHMSVNLARALDSLGEQCGAEFLFLSHLHGIGAERKQWDLRFGERLLRRMCRPERLHLVDSPLLDREVKYLTDICDFIITSRYHGAVFALSGGVPAFLLTQDEHTRAKMNGLTEHLGLDTPVLDAVSPNLAGALAEAWEGRGELQRTVADANIKARAEVEQARSRITSLYRQAT